MTWAEPPGLVIQLVQTLGRQAEDGSQSASHMIDANRMRADAKKNFELRIANFEFTLGTSSSATMNFAIRNSQFEIPFSRRVSLPARCGAGERERSWSVRL